ncbi:MAG: CheY-like chemotaxis protein [Polyangiales bacterium]|jgi:CheY-like chemotaxis protein
MKKLKEILLIDDEEADNYYHQRVIRRLGCAERVVVKTNGQLGLDYLTTKTADGYPQPDIVFLDINMPVMNGWEFLRAYAKLAPEQRAHVVLVMLTTSLSEEDRSAAQAVATDFHSKPLKKEALLAILATHFPGLIESS